MNDDRSVNGIEAPSLDASAIRYGRRAKVGLILPSANTAAEPQLVAMLPEDVSLHATRLRLTGSSHEELLAMSRGVEEAAGLVADAGVDLVAFHCTAVSTLDEDLERSIVERAERASGLPVATTAQAIVAALEQLQIRRLVMVSPYIEAINAAESRFLARHGIEVLDAHGLGIYEARKMVEVEPAVWRELVHERARSDADGYFISCTAVRSLEVVEVLEAELGVPVITSNLVMGWHILRRLGIEAPRAGWGRLLRLTPSGSAVG